MTDLTPGQRQCPKCNTVTTAALCPNDGIATIVRTSVEANPTLVQIGDVVAGRYRVTKLIGRGGFGAVCAAEHTGTGQAVALKYLALDPNSTEDDVVKRFFQEARVTSSLRHPNTVRVFDFGQAENGALFMAMELLHGPTLDQHLRDLAAQGEVLTQAQAVDVGIAVLRALGEAHGANLVHRDLKPANIMLAEVPNDDPVVKVLDFGIARAKDSSLTGSGRALGTPAYMSPEQCRGAELDGRSDLYSLAIILYRCVAGQLPFTDSNPLTLMYQHDASEPPALRTVARTPLSDAFVEIVHRALAKPAAARFDDAKAMRLALEAARNGPVVEATPGTMQVLTGAARADSGEASVVTLDAGSLPKTPAQTPTLATPMPTPATGSAPTVASAPNSAHQTAATQLDKTVLAPMAPAAAAPQTPGPAVPAPAKGLPWPWIGATMVLGAVAVVALVMSGRPGSEEAVAADKLPAAAVAPGEVPAPAAPPPQVPQVAVAPPPPATIAAAVTPVAATLPPEPTPEPAQPAPAAVVAPAAKAKKAAKSGAEPKKPPSPAKQRDLEPD